jgi:hypothetical protein
VNGSEGNGKADKKGGANEIGAKQTGSEKLEEKAAEEEDGNQQLENNTPRLLA